jgi:hypothetical protein
LDKLRLEITFSDEKQIFQKEFKIILIQNGRKIPLKKICENLPNNQIS